MTKQLQKNEGLDQTGTSSRWLAMFNKELIEKARNYKLVWIPLVFIVLGMMQPVSTYLMPVILEKAGSLPEGTVLNIPMPSAAEVLASTLQQFSTIGVLLLALAAMGAVSGERNIAPIILVKPVPMSFFITSKWASYTVVTWGSILLGYGAAYYCTVILFGNTSFASFVQSWAIYCLWLTLMITIVIFFSSCLKSGAGAAFSAIGITLLLSLLVSFFPKQMGWSPGALSGYAASIVVGVEVDYKLWIAIVASIGLIVLLLAGATTKLRAAQSIGD